MALVSNCGIFTFPQSQFIQVSGYLTATADSDESYMWVMVTLLYHACQEWHVHMNLLCSTVADPGIQKREG